MLHYTDLEQTIFSLTNNPKIDRFIVISGYLGIGPIERLAEIAKNIDITIIYGMYGEIKISRTLHEELLRVQQKYSNVSIYYSTIPVHSKIYFVGKGTRIKNALVGSANFSVNGMQNYREVLADAEETSFKGFQTYFSFVMGYSISCNSENIQFRKNGSIRIQDNQPLEGERICKMSLLGRNGKVQKKAGLNWGLSDGHVNDGDAYIKITKDYIKKFPELFPPKKVQKGNQRSGKKDNDEVELIWDDGRKMKGLLEGSQTVKKDLENGESAELIYPKQLSSYPSKNVLGVYLRGRLGFDLKHEITRNDLLKYGRIDIDIQLIDEGIYKLNFSTLI